MNMRRSMLTLAVIALLSPALLAQGPGPRMGPPWWEMPWWNSPLVRDLNLSESQMRDIRSAVNEYRGTLMDLRESIKRADSELDAVLTASPLDQRKATEAIDRLANARADMTRTLSQMTVRLRAILTDEQWQELHQRASERRPGGRFGGRGRGRGGLPPGPPQGSPPDTLKQ